MNKTINTIKCSKANHNRNKVLAVLIVIIVFLSSFTVTTSAVTIRTNSWNLIVSQVDNSFYYAGGNQGVGSGWSEARINAWTSGKILGSEFNQCVVSTDNNENVIYQLEYIYDNSDPSLAASLGTKWNNLYVTISNSLAEVNQLCSGGNNPPTINGSQVTDSQYINLSIELTNEYSDLNELIDEINENYISATYDSNSIIKNSTIGFFQTFEWLWNALGNIIKTIGTGTVNTDNIFGISWSADDIESVANTVSGIVKTFAYALAVILFGINVTQTSLQYELLTLRGGIKIFARVLLVKIWIDLAIKICIYILNIVNSLAIQVLNGFTTFNLNMSYGDFIYSGNAEISNSWFNGVASVLNFLSNILWALPTIILLVVLIVCVCSVFIKIVARAFELTSLVTVSPLFFATLVGEETRHYFKKFVGAFLSTAGYIVFMGIVYAVATIWIADCTSNSVTSYGEMAVALITILPRCLIIIACCHIMRKPPKVLTSLLDGG